MLRRAFLQTAVAASASAAANSGTEPVPLRLGFDTYSVRDFHWKALQLLDYAASVKVDTIQISSLGDYESLAPEHLARVKERAAQLGIALDAGMGCICPLSSSWGGEDIREGLRVAHTVGATSMRCFMGSDRDRRGPQPLEALMEKTAQVIRSVRTEALDLGVKIAIENHAGDLQARELRSIIEEAGKDVAAACLDTGNPMWVVEDPLVTLEVLAPYVVSSHVRDSAVYETPRGAAAQWVPLGDGSIDYKKFIARFRELCPNAYLQLEIITGRPPRELPYLEPAFWKAFPNANASEFARFVALAKNGHPFTGFMVVEDGSKAGIPEYAAALREQQKVDLERSLDYAKHVLGAGVHWRS